MTIELTGEQRQILREGITKAYPSKDELQILMAEKMGVNLEEIARGTNYQQQVFYIIQYFEVIGIIQDFIQVIVQEKPKSPHLRRIRDKFFPIINYPESEAREAKDVHVLFEDHKYGGELVTFDLDFDAPSLEDSKIGVIISISFGQVDEQFQYRGRFLTMNSACVRFGVRHGKLRLSLHNGMMRLNQRDFQSDLQGNWQVRATGTSNAPVWEFEAENQSSILSDSRRDQRLGIVDMTDTYCELEALFQVQVNDTDLQIMAQSGLWEENDRPQDKAFKRLIFFKKIVEPKLQEYISKVRLRYG